MILPFCAQSRNLVESSSESKEILRLRVQALEAAIREMMDFEALLKAEDIIHQMKK